MNNGQCENFLGNLSCLIDSPNPYNIISGFNVISNLNFVSNQSSSGRETINMECNLPFCAIAYELMVSGSLDLEFIATIDGEFSGVMGFRHFSNLLPHIVAMSI